MVWNRNGKRHSKYVGSEDGIYRVLSRIHLEIGDLTSRHVVGPSISVAPDLPVQQGDSRRVEAVDGHRSADRDTMEKGRHLVRPWRPVDGKGMRVTTGLMFLTVVAVGLMFLNLHGYSQVCDAQKEVELLQAQLANSQQRVADLQQKYENAMANANISEVARDLGLVSSKSVPAVELTVLEDVQYMPGETIVLPADALATILGN